MKKRMISAIIALVLMLSLCACGDSTPSVETLVSLADQIVSNYEPVTELPYKFHSLGYDDEENAYMVAVMVDREKVSQSISEMDFEEQYVDLAIEAAVTHYDEYTDAITLELGAIKLTLDANFMDTDVTVMVGFFDRNGDVVQIAD